MKPRPCTKPSAARAHPFYYLSPRQRKKAQKKQRRDAKGQPQLIIDDPLK